MNFQQLKHFLEKSKNLSQRLWCTTKMAIKSFTWSGAHTVLKLNFLSKKQFLLIFNFFPIFSNLSILWNFVEFVNFSNLFNLSQIIDLWHENSNYSFCQITIFWTKVCILTYCVVMWRWHMNNLRITGFQAKKEKTLESTPDGLLASSFASSLPYNVLS